MNMIYLIYFLQAFTQLMLLVRCLTDLIPSGGRKMSEGDEKLVVDGANGVGGEKLEVLNKMLDGLLIDVRNSGKDGGILNEGVGADYVQKEKLVPQGFGSQDVGLRSVISFLLYNDQRLILNHTTKISFSSNVTGGTPMHAS